MPFPALPLPRAVRAIPGEAPDPGPAGAAPLRRRIARRCLGFAAALAASAAAAAEVGAGGAAGPLRVVFAGQALVRHDVRTTAPASFRSLQPVLAGHDVVFTQLEAVIKGPEAGAPTRTPALLHTTDADALDGLAAEGFNLFALSGNHAGDLNTGGIVSTLKAFEARGLAHAGTGRTLAAAAAPVILATPHGRVALVAFASGKIRDGGAATADRPGVNELRFDEKTKTVFPEDVDRILGAVAAAAAESDFVIVYQHNHYWETPMTKTAAWMKAWAHRCIDAGADAFVEHGEPILHGVEIYHGHPIFYGLGNFAFQTSSDDLWPDPATWEGVVASCEFAAHGQLTALRLQPIALNDKGVAGPTFLATRGWPTRADGARGRAILERMGSLGGASSPHWTIAPDGSAAVWQAAAAGP
jgi:poly-gamma-glutamate synthesis protein (capsule biosynthesis protein)